jgi:hypothetical protein
MATWDLLQTNSPRDYEAGDLIAPPVT